MLPSGARTMAPGWPFDLVELEGQRQVAEF